MKFLKFSFLQYVAVFLSIIANFFLAKYISKDNYGLYSLGLVFFNIINGICDYGLERNGLVRLNKFIKGNDDDEYMVQFITRTFITVVFSVALVGYILIEGFSIYLCFYILATLVVSIVPKYYFDFHNGFIKESGFLIADRFSFVAMVLLLFFSRNLTVFSLALVYFISRFIYFLLALSEAFKHKNQLVFNTFIVIRAKIVQLFKDNVLFWLVTVFNIILLYVNQLVLTSNSGVKTLATFAFAMQFISLLRILQTQYLRWNTPFISNEISHDRLSFQTINKILLKGLAFSAVASIGLYFCASFIISRFYPKFHDSIPILLILCLWSVIYGPGLVNSLILSNKIAPHKFFILSVSFTVLSITANVLLGSGAMITTFSIIVPHSISIFIQYYFTYRSYHVNYKG